jgi:hypothetical protein
MKWGVVAADVFIGSFQNFADSDAGSYNVSDS